jgi:hypothetical protein
LGQQTPTQRMLQIPYLPVQGFAIPAGGQYRARQPAQGGSTRPISPR